MTKYKLKPHLKTYIQEKCPQGITLIKDTNLYVKVSKTINGKPEDLTKSIRMGLAKSMNDAEVKEAFNATLSEALNIQRQFKEQINNPNFTSFRQVQAVGVGTLQGVFDMMFVSEWGQKSDKQQYLVRNFFNDLKEYFGADKRLSTFTSEQIDGFPNKATGELEDGFKQWVARKIAERPKNMTGTVSHNSINKRLGVLRSIWRYALSKRLLSNDQLINPDPRVKNMGIVDLPRGETKRKTDFKLFEQEQFLAVIKKSGDEFWYDHWAWAFDTGMRHDGELDKFTIDNVDFGRKEIIFWRNKTDGWSTAMPLTPRCLEIAKRRLKDAQGRADRRVFATTAGSRRNNWEKYIRMCNFHKHFTPYVTRHTYITLLAEAGVNQKTVMELAGHSCIETTLTYYTKSTSKTLNDAIMSLHNAREKLLESNNDSIDVEAMNGHNSRKALK